MATTPTGLSYSQALAGYCLLLVAAFTFGGCQAQHLTATPERLPWEVRALAANFTRGGEAGNSGYGVYRMEAYNPLKETVFIIGFADSLGNLLPEGEVWELAPKAEATFEATRAGGAPATPVLEGQNPQPQATRVAVPSSYVVITWRLGETGQETTTRLSPVALAPDGPALPR